MWALATVLGTVFLMALMVWSERRSGRRHQHRYASWRCPRCGTAFGLQPAQSWLARVDPGPSSHGPALHCASCAREYWFYEDGRLKSVFNDAGEPVEEEPPEGSSGPGRVM
jgi:hypothetical protein